MPENHPTLQEWQDYLVALGYYQNEITDYVSRYDENGENPTPPRPPLPPQFSGFLNE